MSQTLSLSDEAAEIADAIAQQRNTSPEALVQSLLAAEKARLDAAERANQEGWDEVFRIAREIADTTPEYMRTSNHDWLYDENGLPV